MYLHRGLILLFLVIFIFSPLLQDWVTDNQAAWYRPYIAWLFIILVAYAATHRIGKRDKHV